MWQQLETELSQWLSTFSNNIVQYKNPKQAIIGFPYDGFMSDGMLTDGNTLISIEIEAYQPHPDTNVGKYWLLFNKFKNYDKIILFHIYTPLFVTYGWRKVLGKFYIEKMKLEMPLEYILKEYSKEDDYYKVVAELKREINIVINKELNTYDAKPRS